MSTTTNINYLNFVTYNLKVPHLFHIFKCKHTKTLWVYDLAQGKILHS